MSYSKDSFVNRGNIYTCSYIPNRVYLNKSAMCKIQTLRWLDRMGFFNNTFPKFSLKNVSKMITKSQESIVVMSKDSNSEKWNLYMFPIEDALLVGELLGIEYVYKGRLLKRLPRNILLRATGIGYLMDKLGVTCNLGEFKTFKENYEVMNISELAALLRENPLYRPPHYITPIHYANTNNSKELALEYIPIGNASEYNSWREAFHEHTLLEARSQGFHISERTISKVSSYRALGK